MEEVEDGRESASGKSVDFGPLLEKLQHAGLSGRLRDQAGFPFGLPFVEFDIPRGNRTRVVYVTEALLPHVMNLDVGRLSALEGYDAVFLRGTGVVECLLDSGGFGAFSPMAMSSLVRRFRAMPEGEVGDFDGERELSFETSIPGLRASLVPKSVAASLLSTRWRERPAIRLAGDCIGDEGIAVECLERVGNALLFRMDLANGINAQLRRETDRTEGRRVARRRRVQLSKEPLRHQYDAEALSLYWYARKAEGMPLLRYLAFYQVLEYYFPRYVEAEAQESVRQELKDPRFDAMSGDDVARIVRVVRSFSPGGNRGSEQYQLGLVVRAALQGPSAAEWLERNGEGAQYLASSDAKELSEHRVNVRNTTVALTEQIAARIYDIRCRIVHSKGDGRERKPLLPFSAEVGRLRWDLLLLEEVAQKALIAGSSALKLSGVVGAAREGPVPS